MPIRSTRPISVAVARRRGTVTPELRALTAFPRASPDVLVTGVSHCWEGGSSAKWLSAEGTRVVTLRVPREPFSRIHHGVVGKLGDRTNNGRFSRGCPLHASILVTAARQKNHEIAGGKGGKGRDSIHFPDGAKREKVHRPQ